MPQNPTRRRKTPKAPDIKPLPPPAPTDQRDPNLLQWIEKVKAMPDIREDKVRAIRSALAAGTYDVNARLEDLCDHWPDKLDNVTDIDP